MNKLSIPVSNHHYYPHDRGHKFYIITVIEHFIYLFTMEQKLYFPFSKITGTNPLEKKYLNVYLLRIVMDGSLILLI